MSSFAASQPMRAERDEQVLGVQDADDVLGLVLPQRNARVLTLQDLVDHFLRRVVGMSMVCILVRWTMMSSTCRLSQVQHAAEHRRIALGDGAADGLELDGAADLLVRGEDVGGIVVACSA